MELLIELFIDLILEGSVEISKNKKVSKWIRYPLIFLISTLFIVITLGCFVLGILIYKDIKLFGLVLIIFGVIFLFCGFNKFKKIYIKRKEENEKNN